jgi:hypothetical protein
MLESGKWPRKPQTCRYNFLPMRMRFTAFATADAVDFHITDDPWRLEILAKASWAEISVHRLCRRASICKQPQSSNTPKLSVSASARKKITARIERIRAGVRAANKKVA